MARKSQVWMLNTLAEAVAETSLTVDTWFAIRMARQRADRQVARWSVRLNAAVLELQAMAREHPAAFQRLGRCVSCGFSFPICYCEFLKSRAVQQSHEPPVQINLWG